MDYKTKAKRKAKAKATTVETVGTDRVVRREHAATTNRFTKALAAMRLQWSETKDVTCASSDPSAHAVCNELQGINVAVGARCVSLGTGLGAGRRRNMQQTNKRLKEFRERQARFKAL